MSWELFRSIGAFAGLLSLVFQIVRWWTERGTVKVQSIKMSKIVDCWSDWDIGPIAKDMSARFGYTADAAASALASWTRELQGKPRAVTVEAEFVVVNNTSRPLTVWHLELDLEPSYIVITREAFARPIRLGRLSIPHVTIRKNEPLVIDTAEWESVGPSLFHPTWHWFDLHTRELIDPSQYKVVSPRSSVGYRVEFCVAARNPTDMKGGHTLVEPLLARLSILTTEGHRNPRFKLLRSDVPPHQRKLWYHLPVQA